MTTPVTTGISVTYVNHASLLTVIMYANTAVKNGVVAPTAWLKDTGRYLNEIFPHTTEVQKITLSAEIFINCKRERIVCIGTIFIHAIAT
eukprot:Gb_07131 [translate_table: standard]